MIYFLLEVKMENQINIGDRNTQQMGQNSVNQGVPNLKKFKVNYWVVSIIILLLFIFGVFVLYLLNKERQGATTVFTKPTEPSIVSPTSGKDYCITMLSKTNDLRGQQTPDDYINQSANKKYLEVWKELLIKNNKFTEEYFNKHIRISSNSIFKPNTGIPPEPDKYFEIQYYFITDWLFFLNRDGFVIKNQNSDQYLTEEEIISMAGSFSKPIVERAWQMNISYLRNKNGELIEEIRPCEEIVEKLRSLNPVLTHNQPDLRPFAEGLIIRTFGEAGSNKCPRATISLSTAEVISYSPSEPCVVY